MKLKHPAFDNKSNMNLILYSKAAWLTSLKRKNDRFYSLTTERVWDSDYLLKVEIQLFLRITDEKNILE